ncbi:GNAT family N-acetyltransferase [Aliiglaciecola litoralis]
MPKIITKQEKASLLLSELNYFRAGSKVKDISHGQLCWLEEFNQISAATILHNVNGTRALAEVEWLDRVKTLFSRLGASQYRFYLTQFDDSHIERLKQFGLQVTVELGMLGHLEDIGNADFHDAGELVLIDDDRALSLKRKLYQECEVGADGHQMQNGVFADYEQVKCNSGYMSSYLYYHNNRLKGTVSLALEGRFARLKNLYIHPKYRGQGSGKPLVTGLMTIAKEQGAEVFGTYALQGGISQRLYSSCGLRPCISQVEGVGQL